jgi:hypothetical protein
MITCYCMYLDECVLFRECEEKAKYTSESSVSWEFNLVKERVDYNVKEATQEEPMIRFQSINVSSDNRFN